MGLNSHKIKKQPVPLGVGIYQHPAVASFIAAIAAFFWAIFILMVWIFATDLYTAWDSSHWVATDATVIKAQVKTSSGGENGPSYSLSVSYSYLYNAQSYISDRYAMKQSSDREVAIERMADRLPPGKQITCYVNPKHPSVAVIDRSGSGNWIYGLFPLLLPAVAAFFSTREAIRLRKIVRYQWPRGNNKPMPRPADFAPPGEIIVAPPDVCLPLLDKAPRVLISNVSSGGLLYRLFLVLTVALFCAPLILQLTTDWITWLIFPKGGFVLLAAIGLILFLPMLLHDQYIAMRTRITIHLPQGNILPGESLQLSWKIPKRADRIPHLWMQLQGREQYGPWDSAKPSVFQEITLIDTTTPAEIQSGQVTVPLPADLMHSLIIGPKAIQWFIIAQSDGPRIRRVRERFAVVVLPAKWPDRLYARQN